MKRGTGLFAIIASVMLMHSVASLAQSNIDTLSFTTEETVSPITMPSENEVYPSDQYVDRTSWEYLLRSRLRTLAKEAGRSRYTTGICVYDLTGDSMLFMYNAQKRFRPASNEKLLTSISTLDILGKDSEFSTSVYIDGHISNDRVMKVNERKVVEDCYCESVGKNVPTEIVFYDTTYVNRRVLHGNIYVKGTFDPLFTTDDLHEMAKEIGKIDFEELDGEFIGDISMKDSLIFGKGWCWDEMPSSYVPWLSPLLFNEGIRLRSKNEDYMKNPDTYFLKNLLVSILCILQVECAFAAAYA